MKLQENNNGSNNNNAKNVNAVLTSLTTYAILSTVGYAITDSASGPDIACAYLPGALGTTWVNVPS